ncbi:sulfotransferase [Roseinatronobacter sp. S2]|uniref:sulfotransferase family protein n=1 Tax=Roseinatronobacter sp. S2 TaxID=3035471 RepID=UPI00240F7535|nr:sulfotransferase [Roseinatronobacter sp. S2]WFE75341.1 sulfotransferase [Roseinatronobacter sp. S2]
MALPNFLIIGAMKAGTTTLYADLYNHPDIFLTSDKEPSGLRWCDTPEGVRRYERLFERAGNSRVIGEASTFYTKRPYSDGLAERARLLLGADVTILYLVREPVKRMVSHYHHEIGLQEEARSLNSALLDNPDYVNFSRYAWQLAPWQAAFGPERVHVLQFERYIADRRATLTEVCQLLGVDPAKLDIDEGRAFNASAGKRVARGPWRRIISSRWYRDHIRWRFSQGLRDKLKVVLPKAPEKLSESLSPETEALLRKRLGESDVRIWSQADPNIRNDG